MKRILFFLVMLLLVGSVGSATFAATPSYSTDFSTNPGWVTDQPDKHYWDSANQWYHVRAENNPPGYPGPTTYQPNRYAGLLLPEALGGFHLRWDTQVTHSEWSAGIDFGVFDSQMAFAGRGGGQGITVGMSWTDPGNSLFLHVSGVGGVTGASTESVGGDFWQVGDWYRSYLSYDPWMNLVDLVVTDRATGTSIWSASLAVPGGEFGRELIFLGNTRYGCIDLEGGVYGISAYDADEGNIDNVFLRPIPAPGALVLGGIGVTAVGWLRRRRAL